LTAPATASLRHGEQWTNSVRIRLETFLGRTKLDRPSYPSSERLAADAPRIQCPVLFQRRVADELLTIEGQEQLFQLLASDDKELRMYPGVHTPAGRDQTDDMVYFLSTHLGVRSS
jgi:hypothetical protein